MPNDSGAVARHYATAGLADRILDALASQGLPTEHLSAEMLFPLDQLHGRELTATEEHLGKLALGPQSHVLDVGSGIGGPARYMATKFGARVTGIDLTPEFVATASELTRRCGMADRVAFQHADARAMPFGEGVFDAVLCQYVAMNIADKAGVLTEIGRVLRSGGKLLWTEAVLGAGGPPDFPLPWARGAEASFLTEPEPLRAAVEAAGFNIREWIDETDAIKAFAEGMRAATPAPLKRLTNLVVLGDDFMDRLKNFNRAIADGRLRSVLVLAER